MAKGSFQMARPLIQLIGMVVWLMSVAFVAAAQSPVAGDDEIVLRPGDAIRLTVWRNADLTGEFAIGPDGSIMHPMLYRKFSISNVPLQLAETSLREFLMRFEANPEFVMEPLLRVSIAGEVARPNLYQLRPGTTVTQAIALAGGPTERGRRDRVTLRREGTSRTISVTSPESGIAQLRVRSGDEIIIERRSAVFREVVVPVATIIGATAAVLRVVVPDR
jgi:protein involved in polysaccharide export with SLBB domain